MLRKPREIRMERQWWVGLFMIVACHASRDNIFRCMNAAFGKWYDMIHCKSFGLLSTIGASVSKAFLHVCPLLSCEHGHQCMALTHIPFCVVGSNSVSEPILVFFSVAKFFASMKLIIIAKIQEKIVSSFCPIFGKIRETFLMMGEIVSLNSCLAFSFMCLVILAALCLPIGFIFMVTISVLCFSAYFALTAIFIRSFGPFGKLDNRFTFPTCYTTFFVHLAILPQEVIYGRS